MMQAAVGLEDPRSQLVLASAPASEDEDRLVHVADQCCLNLGFDDGWCLTDEEPLDPAELSTSGAPTCPEELSHSDRPPPPAELSDSAELCGSDRPSSSPAELSHCDAARSELPAEESRRESSDEIDWSWLAALEAHRMSRDESPRPASAWLRSSMRRVRPFRLSEPPSIPASSAPLGPLATPDTVLHILAHNNRRPNSAPGGGVSRARRDFPRRYSSYNAAALDSSVTNLTQAAEPVAVESPSSDEEDEDLSSASDGAQTSGAEQATDSFAETMSNGTSSRQTHEPEIQNSPLGAWPHGLSSMLASLGCTLGLFNISRFAILSVHFGANFIVQFLFLTLVIGIPLFTLHTCLGQCLGAGVMDMWHISPIFQGIGIALLISQALIGIYSVVGVSWMFIYFRDSFITKQDSYRWAEPYDPYREESHTTKNVSWKLEETVPDYFNGIVLQRHNLEMPESSFGHLKFQVAFNLAVVWMIVFVSLSKGLKSYGKVVYVFSLFPVFGTLVLCTKLLGLVPTNTKHQVFPQTAWGEFFLNTKCWVAATAEVFSTWGLLGATAMQITSHNRHKHLLNRDTTLVVVLTLAVLLLAAFLASTCVNILHSQGFTYIPSSFEHVSTYGFLQPDSEPLPPSVAGTPVRYMTHTVLIAGSRVTLPGVDPRQQSGYQVLRLATELVPSTLALLGADVVSPFWAVLFYFVLILFGIAQQLCIWHCVITGIMAISAASLKSWETTITFFSCVCGFILGLPMTTELGIFVVHFLDYTIGCSWWLMVLYLLEILAVFVVRGRPYSGETVVTTMFSRSAGCLQAWAAPLLIFTWNVILPVALVVTCITVFKNGQFRDLYNWHSVTYNYWPVWTREVGCMLQLLPIILVPFVCIVQTFRYLSIGPPDILDRIQLLYRPPISRQDSLEPPNSPPNSATLVPPVVNTTATSLAPEATVTTEDPPPKYTPPPSYTTATGARIAKLLRQSFRRSMRRLAGALGDNGTLPPPPDYTAVLVEINRTLQDHSEHLPEPSSAHPVHTSTMTATDVACILRSSLRRSVMRNRDIEHLVDGAVPVHHDVALPTTRAGSDSKPEAESTSVI
ncbi:sodium- and chloride-dependent glycine transporter 1 isoform X2 [Zootermopsis nevadensis]|uniref:Sodium-and chloride-dependent glycine transporter 2 n=2 Tax=Zootermopsis nevadensis TaxID=136037 RepID=A0A067QYW6_ZOONE|nr:sodium- and chloride-dependent glycine transporter 1 isoform X2 [Zootermopsis nevadensis]XP_021927102.1 sodium- and chloride-dependent glycine transporter 1 isoform X2 [Zootermopsis nevadensis]XP_021927103.1 sodium- and chloride-dependent glycine transporter 1 isoform X2 [Zootermopsis nevadensis]XP_021927104.1 sodium- and chloride-dependent glycine transporter 1 isoform X2 [Zootermopsis nevadensis]XP_021927105.1 sodium- and chloride-dependent glycine transporter 1 isoform X2 [Zootermopsis ne